ncbi:MAG: hypothetical protein ABI488_11510 [Polyangiaceae bacterium]
MKLSTVVIFALSSGLVAGSGCSSDTSTPAVTGTFDVAAAVSGPQDDHCTGQPLGVSDPAACTTAENSDAAGAGGAAPDDTAPADTSPGGASATSDCNLVHDADYGETLYNSAGDDDDCKYQVAWTSTPVALNQDVTFKVTASAKKDNSPLEGLTTDTNALSRVEVYIPCDSTHRPPNVDFKATISETAPGVYTAGPFRFDKPGRWVVRFHFYEQCNDQEDSPHGHAAFFVDVP